MFISSQIFDSEFSPDEIEQTIKEYPNITIKKELHLSVSMRSFRSEKVSLLIRQILDIEKEAAKETFASIQSFPIYLTRDLNKAKDWLRKQARGSERYGLLASARADRLKPYAIQVRTPIEPIYWFLNGKDDVRSSYYLEDVATEYKVQGLELDWTCVTWDGDFRFHESGWQHFAFEGTKWNKVNKKERQMYLKNAYRVLLTRARQGMIIFIPEGDSADLTRKADFYDPTFSYLKQIGFEVI